MFPIKAHRTVIGLFCSRRIKKSRCLIKNSYKKDRNLTEWTCLFQGLVLVNVLSFNLVINFHYKCVKASQLTREGIENNPGPSISPSRAQQLWRLSRNAMYKHSVRVGSWKLLDLDIILGQGDELFKSVRINKSLAMDELHFHLRVMIFPAKDFLMKVICLLI